jgi:hypothetical protein
MNTSSVISQNIADVQLWQRRVGLTHSDMKILAKHVAARLEDRSFCVVFEGDLERCWPRKEIAPERERKIQAFAESRLDCCNCRRCVRYEGNISKIGTRGFRGS